VYFFLDKKVPKNQEKTIAAYGRHDIAFFHALRAIS